MAATHNNIIIGRAHQSGIGVKTAYESSVIARAVQRAGCNPHLKGHIHEVLIQDTRNVRNLLSMNGASTQLTKSTTASTVDMVTMRGGKVIERIQVKDVTSSSGINKLVKQCADGKYRSAKLIGSDETAQMFNKAAEKAGISKRMSSSGVSSKTSTNLAQRAGAAGSGTLGSAMAQAARSGGAAGAVIGAGVESVRGLIDWSNGEADGLEVAGRITKAAAKGGVSGAAAGAAATAAGAGTVAAVTALGVTGGAAVAATVAAPVLAAVAVGYIASEAFDGACSFLSDLF